MPTSLWLWSQDCAEQARVFDANAHGSPTGQWHLSWELMELLPGYATPLALALAPALRFARSGSPLSFWMTMAYIGSTHTNAGQTFLQQLAQQHQHVEGLLAGRRRRAHCTPCIAS